MIGAVVFAAGIPGAFTRMDFSIGVLGFVIMRSSQIYLWARVAWSSCKERKYALIQAIGIGICQLGWVSLVLWLPVSFMYVGFIFLIICELTIPWLGVRPSSPLVVGTFH
jgi:hypothetical protein